MRSLQVFPHRKVLYERPEPVKKSVVDYKAMSLKHKKINPEWGFRPLEKNEINTTNGVVIAKRLDGTYFKKRSFDTRQKRNDIVNMIIRTMGGTGVIIQVKFNYSTKTYKHDRNITESRLQIP
jgi:hypothetical protein